MNILHHGFRSIPKTANNHGPVIFATAKGTIGRHMQIFISKIPFYSKIGKLSLAPLEFCSRSEQPMP
jgi:hypothetical protein